MTSTLNWRVWSAAMAVTVLMAGCGGGGSDAPATGALSVSLTDAPIEEAAEVRIVFTGIELHRSNGSNVTLDFASQPKSIDLLKLRGGVTGALTEGAEIPAGEYDWMRLMVLAEKNSQVGSYIKLLSGAQYPLWIPSGDQTGLKLVRPFTVAQGSTTRLLVDFDLRKSIVAPPGQDPNYVMRPTLRLLDQIQVGKIAATLDVAALATAQLGAGASPSTCKPGVYLFAGGAATPDDQDRVDADGFDPILYEAVPYDGATPLSTVTLPFVEVGIFTLAATCNFDRDVADMNDYNPAAAPGAPDYQSMKWSTVGNVAVTSGNTTAISLP
jgi:hypothetical protein